MSIRDRGYQRYEGERTPPLGRWAVVLRHSLRMTAKQPWVVAIMIISAFPPLVGAGLMYLSIKALAAFLAQIPPDQIDPSKLPPDPALWVLHIQTTSYWVVPLLAMLMAMFAGGSAIADDMRFGAFQFYFARPVSREQYLIGKLVPVVLLVFIVSFVPSLILTLVRISMFRAGMDSLGQMMLLPLRALALSLIHAVLLGVPAVALSSLSKRRGLVQGGFAALYGLPWILGWILTRITRSAWPSVLSIPAQLESLGAMIFGYKAQPDERMLPWLAALIVSGAIVTGSAVLLRSRLAAVEVVAG